MTLANKRLILFYGISYFIGSISLLLIGCATYLNLKKTVNHSNNVDKTNTIINKTETLLKLLLDAETGVRGYHISENPIYLGPYNESKDSVKIFLNVLKLRLSQNDSQKSNVRKLGRAIDEEFGILQNGIKFFKSNQKEKIKELYFNQTDKKKMDYIRFLIAEIKAGEYKILDGSKAELQQSRINTTIFITAIITFYIIISFISYRVIQKLLKEKDKYEEKLYDSNNNLEATLEELRLSNVQVNATNESLKAVNEELASANEELTATTEEYYAAHEQVIITNKKLEELNNELEKRVETRVQELQEQNITLKKINNDLDDFVYTAAHDLKSPVNTIEGLVDVLHLQMNGDLGDEQKQTLAMMTTSSKKLKNTIYELTQILRVQKEEGLQKDHISLDKIFQEVCEDLREMIEKFKPNFIINWEVENIYYTHKHIRSILYNLISNALKYHSPERLPVIRVSSNRHDYRTELNISDNGLGIPEKQLPKLFSMFKRFHDHVEGSGIGLYTVKRIIENNGGQIKVESNLGIGTRFTIIL